jgi:Mg-chelatase subunit ChlD
MAASNGGLVVRFTYPFTLMALLVLPWFWWMARHRLLTIGWLRLTWRASTALLLILGASGVAIATRRMPVTAVVALDRSASVPPRAQSLALTRVNAFTSTMKAGDRLGLVSFGTDAALDLRPGEAVRHVAVRSSVAGAGTDIGGALRLARAVVPADGLRRIVLISDGRDTVGAAEREALNTAAAGIAIDVVVPPDQGVLEPVRVTRVIAPAEVAMREPYVVSVEVAGTPASRGTVAIYRDDEMIATRQVVVGVNGSASVDVSERQDRARAYTYRAVSRSEPPDGAPAGAVVVVQGEPTILYVSAGFRALDSILTRAGYRVTSVAPEQVPQTAAALSSFDGVVLDDVPVDRLTGTAAEALAAYVQDAGGGLLILGSARALTPEAYTAGPLEHIIPVDLRRRSGQRTPAVDLVLVFDKSGSMADLSDGVPKIEIARQAVLRAVEAMPAGDSIGVLAFDSKSETVATLATARDAQVLRTALRDVLPGGSTAIAPAVTTALEWLHAPGRPAAARRQILLISDGRTSDDDGVRLQGLARTGGAELSVVAIGPNANRPLLETLATASGGRAYFPENLRDLPRTVARAAARSSGGGVVQERFALRGAPHPVLTGIDLGALPTMNGYVVGAAKATAAVILASHLDDPILCAWRAGLGRVAVFTADLASPWSAPLRAWRDDGRLWAQTIRWVGRRETNRAIQFKVRDGERGPRLEADFETSDGSAIAPDDVSAIVRQPGGATTEIALEAFAPGRYEAPFPAADTGPYYVTLTARDRRSGSEDRLVRAVYWSADRERQARGTDIQFLSRLASLTGGRLLRDDESPFDGPRPAAYRDASIWASATALAMFVIDIATGAGFRRTRFGPWRQGVSAQNRRAA